MKDQNGKGPNGERWSARPVNRLTVLLRAPIRLDTHVVDASAGMWRKYCDSRLRQFAAGR
jgi:hypothetical protein